VTPTGIRKWPLSVALGLCAAVSFSGCVDRSQVRSLAGLPDAFRTASERSLKSTAPQSIVYELPHADGTVILLGGKNIVVDPTFPEPLQREMSEISRSEETPHLFYLRKNKVIWSGRLDPRLIVPYSKAAGPRVHFSLTPVEPGRVRISVESVGGTPR
jgi:hypothetical protein